MLPLSIPLGSSKYCLRKIQLWNKSKIEYRVEFVVNTLKLIFAVRGSDIRARIWGQWFCRYAFCPCVFWKLDKGQRLGFLHGHQCQTLSGLLSLVLNYLQESRIDNYFRRALFSLIDNEIKFSECCPNRWMLVMEVGLQSHYWKR